MRIAVACDHGGFVQKDAIVEHLKSLGHEVFDLGTNSEDSVDYPDFADRAAKAPIRMALALPRFWSRWMTRRRWCWLAS